MFVNPTACAGLTDVTPTDEDTNSLLTDNAHRTIPGKVAMQDASGTNSSPCGQIHNQ